ncbi:MAG: nitrate/nitrite transporter NrtS [Planctomycetota bacterium]
MNRSSSIIAIAISGPVVKRALVLAAIVGTLLILINHGKCIATGHFNVHCMMCCVLTVMVPYCVSTISSVLAKMDCAGDELES